MILDRLRGLLSKPVEAEPEQVLEPYVGTFAEVFGRAPVAALVLDGNYQVVAANLLASRLFGVDPGTLPASLVEVTREAHIEAALRSNPPEAGDVRLVHHHRVVRLDVAAGPAPGLRTVFISDLTELRRLETVRQEFVANLSHELKTPITSLRLAAESLIGDLPEDARTRFAERAVREADHLSAIVDNLRQLAEIEAGHIVVRSSNFDLAEMLREVAGRVKVDRPLEVNVPEGMMVSADRTKLAQAVGNLLDNAAKFSPPGSKVDVSAAEVGAELVIRVRDRGPGISPEHWDRVFERFYKVDPARSRDVPGSGLGLAITKHLVMAHGGRVWTEAARKGGQVFALAMPLPAITQP